MKTLRELKSNFWAFQPLLFLVFVIWTSSANAHDEKPLWLMNEAELSELDKTIAQHRLDLLSAMNEALVSGISTSRFQRDYRFDTDTEVMDIPRSVLNRVIISSLELETASMKRYLACGLSCDHSLETDLKGHHGAHEKANAIRQLWPKVKSSFRILWFDVPVGVWLRTIHAARYSRTIGANIHYQATAYGRFSMVLGATAFGAAFGVTELAESMFMGPLHLVCQANYFWSVALGAAVAGLSRDVKALLLFEHDRHSFTERFSQATTNFFKSRRLRQFEDRVLFKTLSDGGIERFEKITRRQAHVSILQPLLERISPAQAVALDTLLWSELANSVADQRKPRFRFATDQREHLFASELAKLFSADTTPEKAVAHWQDHHASIRTFLRIVRNDMKVRHQQTGTAAAALRALGQLDIDLRRLDLFNLAWLTKYGGQAESQDREAMAQWLRHILSEFVSLAIETSADGADLKATALRRKQLTKELTTTVRRGHPNKSTSERPADGTERLEAAFRNELASLAARARARTCSSMFQATP